MDSFFKFVRALIADRMRAVEMKKVQPSSPYGPDGGGWENTSIEDYLESALAWEESTNMGQKQDLSSAPSWREFAAFLYLRKIYE